LIQALAMQLSLGLENCVLAIADLRDNGHSKGTRNGVVRAPATVTRQLCIDRHWGGYG
jgi:hypothetical protein